VGAILVEIGVLASLIFVGARLGAGVSWFVWSYVTSYVASITYTVIVLHGFGIARLRPGFDASLFKDWIRAALPLAAGFLLTNLYFRADIPILQLGSGLESTKMIEAYTRMREIVDELRDEGPTQEEVERARAYAAGRRVLAFENTNAVARYGANQAIVFREDIDPDAAIAALDAVTFDEVREIAAGVVFWGHEEDGALVAVMGLQPVRDVDLIRHAYVLPAYQRHGVGSALIEHLRSAGLGEVVPAPVDECLDAVAHAAHQRGVHTQPGGERDRAVELVAMLADLGDGGASADHCHDPLVLVMERRRRLAGRLREDALRNACPAL